MTDVTLSVTCPVCKAEPGVPCKRPRSRRGPHRERELLSAGPDKAKPPMDPNTTVLVFKVNGVEKGRMAATDPRANRWLTEMALAHKGGAVDYVTDPDFCEAQRMIRGLF